MFKIKKHVNRFIKVLTAVFFIHAIRAVWKPITDQCMLQTLFIGWTFPKISLFATWKQKKKSLMIYTQLKMMMTLGKTAKV